MKNAICIKTKPNRKHGLAQHKRVCTCVCVCVCIVCGSLCKNANTKGFPLICMLGQRRVEMDQGSRWVKRKKIRKFTYLCDQQNYFVFRFSFNAAGLIKDFHRASGNKRAAQPYTHAYAYVNK